MALLLMPLIASLAITAFPTTDERASGEDAKQGPMEVCTDMLDAAKKEDLDRLIGHVTAYGRSRIGHKEKLAIKAAHPLLVALRCVRIDSQDEAHAMIWVYAPDNKSQSMPFSKEAGFWRLDAEAASEKLESAIKKKSK
jgi:hypothetical protein